MQGILEDGVITKKNNRDAKNQNLTIHSIFPKPAKNRLHIKAKVKRLAAGQWFTLPGLRGDPKISRTSLLATINSSLS